MQMKKQIGVIGGGYPRTADRKAVSGCQKKAGTFLQLQCECNGEKGRKSI